MQGSREGEEVLFFFKKNNPFKLKFGKKKIASDALCFCVVAVAPAKSILVEQNHCLFPLLSAPYVYI
jgi:hypothetical protein